MSHPPIEEIALLGRLANELREEFGQRGHLVDKAMEVDSAFRSRSRSSLTGDLVVDAISGAASRAGVDFRSVNGAGREFRFLSTVDRRYRLRRARRDRTGALVVPLSSDSALAIDETSLYREEHWTFLWITDAEGQIAEVLAAEIRDFTLGSPGHLIFGETIPLGGQPPSRGGFWPTEEGLEGFEDFGDDFGTAAS
jgi:hypothetical protein